MVWPFCSGSLELLPCGPWAEGKFPKIGITAEMVNEFFQNLFFVGVCWEHILIKGVSLFKIKMMLLLW